jgi:hypothetical protein
LGNGNMSADVATSTGEKRKRIAIAEQSSFDFRTARLHRISGFLINL